VDSKDSGVLRGEPRSCTAKHSWEHYLQFVEDIDESKADPLLYDSHVKPGASLPVNVGAPVQAPIAKAIKAGGKP
jgi:hypothetical protein